MAKGRRDYTWGFQDETAAGGRYPESFVHSFILAIAAGGGDFIYSYVVPEGYRLAVNLVDLSSTSGVDCIAYVEKNLVSQISALLNGHYCFKFSDQNPLYYSAGETLRIEITNLEEYEAVFYGYIVGALERLI